MKTLREDITVLCCNNTVQETVIDALMLTGWTYAGQQPKKRGDKVTVLKFFRKRRMHSTVR